MLFAGGSDASGRKANDTRPGHVIYDAWRVRDECRVSRLS